MDRRHSPRFGVEVEGIIRSESRDEQTIVISNLSLDGCRFSAPGRRLPAGAPLVIGVGPVAVILASVAWRASAVHGVRFDQPLHPAVLDHIRLFLSKEPALVEELPFEDAA